MSELAYPAPEGHKSKLTNIKGFLGKMAPGVIQGEELQSGVTPTEMRPHISSNIGPDALTNDEVEHSQSDSGDSRPPES